MSELFKPVKNAVLIEKSKKMTKRTKQAISSKQKLYSTAVRLFAKKGYDAVTVDEICTKAGMTKGAFYAHFHSKHDIMIIQLRTLDDAHAQFFQTLSPDLPAREKLAKFLGFVAEKFDEIGYQVQKNLYLAELSPKTSIHYTVDESRPVYRALESILEEGQSGGEFRCDRTVLELRNQILRCVRGVLIEWTITNGGLPVRDGITDLIAVFLDGLTVRP